MHVTWADDLDFRVEEGVGSRGGLSRKVPGLPCIRWRCRSLGTYGVISPMQMGQPGIAITLWDLGAYFLWSWNKFLELSSYVHVEADNIGL